MNFSGLGRQFNDSVATKNAFSSASGSSSSRMFDNKVIGDTPFLKLEKDKSYFIRFVPYVVDETHPKVIAGKLEPGDAAYVMDFNRHVIGANNTSVICPKGTYGHSCPICDKQFALRAENASDKEVASLKSSRRVMYNVVLVDEDPSKVYLLHESQYLFEKEMLAELEKGDDEGEAYDIADFCVGASEGAGLALRVSATETDKNGLKFNEYSFKVVKNKWEVDNSVLDKALPLHKVIVELSKRDLENILYGGDDEEDEDVDDADYGVTPPKAAKVEEEFAPVAEEVDEDEEPVECPSGYTFGKDCMLEEECDNCPLVGVCREEKRRLRAAANH